MPFPYPTQPEIVVNKPLEQSSPSGLYQSQYGHFIGGQWVEGASGATIDLMNPATGETIQRLLDQGRTRPD